jgi:hypothetical protein
MLISRRGERLNLITHPDHGRLAGELCRRWGNEHFAAPAPAEALLIAATHHDDGWTELDGQPAFNPDQHRPAHFLELQLEQTVGPYGRGVDSVYERDPHAGALVSMHWAGLYRTRWGLQAGDPVPHPLAAQVVQEQERRWVAALREAWGGHGPRSEFEHHTWHAYEVLQTLDFLSLALCLVDLDQVTPSDPPIPMPATLPRVDQPVGPRLIPSVPLGASGEHVVLTLRVPEPGVVTLDPYPFADEDFEVSAPVRRLEDQRFSSAAEAAAALHDASPQAVRISVRRP